ncbi:MAG TPA: TolC family protein [Elusimicrobiota bacterium]|nr:TolC family protein [Elusimicrobiota bacterium]
MNLVIVGLMAVLPTLTMAQESGTDAVPLTTLRDVYVSALANSEKIAISEQSVSQAEALYRQTRGANLPDLSFQHDTFWQRRKDTQHTGAFQIQKYGLTGYRELAALRAGRHSIAQAKYDKQRVEQLLLVDVAGAFYGLVEARQNVASTERLIALANDRLNELRERVRVGRSRNAEPIQQDYQITALQSQGEEHSRSVGAYVDFLTYLSGRPVQPPPATEVSTQTFVRSLESYLSRLHSRPDVQSAEAAVSAAKGVVDFRRGDYLPKIDLGLNLYSYRPKFYKETKWDASLGVNVPLWAWGARTGAVDSALAAFRVQEQTLRFVLRQADLEVRNAYRDVLSAQKQCELQAKAVDLARRDYGIQLRDDRQGLVTSLEVLESLNRLNLAELSLTNFQVQSRLNAIKLEIAAGARPEEALK